MERIDLDTERALRRFLSLAGQRYDIVGAVLYGSRARGTHAPDSDADLAVLLEGDHQRVLPTAVAMADLAYDVLVETGINISPLPIWSDEWRDPDLHANPDLLRRIEAEGVRL